MVPLEGLEPPTVSLQGSWSTVPSLFAATLARLWLRSESNERRLTHLDVPLAVVDLPGYAESLCRGYDEHPDIARLAAWHRLERGDSPIVAAALDSNRAKIAAIAAAQSEGYIPRTFPPGVLLALVLHIAAMWIDMPEERSQAINPPSASVRASVVRHSVLALLRE